MDGFISIRGSALPQDQLSRILADYLAVDRARLVRKRLLKCFGSLAVIALFAGLSMHGLTPMARWFPVGLALVPPAGAWIAERRIERRFVDQIGSLEGVMARSARSSPHR